MSFYSINDCFYELLARYITCAKIFFFFFMNMEIAKNFEVVKLG